MRLVEVVDQLGRGVELLGGSGVAKEAVVLELADVVLVSGPVGTVLRLAVGPDVRLATGLEGHAPEADKGPGWVGPFQVVAVVLEVVECY